MAESDEAPEAAGAVPAVAALRWLRQQWRPKLQLSPESRELLVSRAAELEKQALAQEARELQELQQRLESGFQELNGQRRSADGLERSLERQRQSLEAIRGENARLQAQVSDVRQRCQEQVAKNASLSGDLAAKLQARAEAHTQVALLRAALAPAGSDAAASLEEEIKICRAQIRQVLEQNEALERRIAGTSM
ncbi:unnamed protein product [Durusdinium trenchii]|uniref:Uncharacterized protein n=1 Tax=Durusdinium trenchii TaxID=1381693 RepID=A0ABP0R0S7_9DINO